MRRATPLSPACGVILAGLLNGTGPSRHQSLSTLSSPAVGRRGTHHRPLELGHDIARQQFVAVQHLVPRSPVDGLHEEATVPTAALFQTLDPRYAVVRRANNPKTGIGHKIDHLVQWAIKDRPPPVGTLRILPQIAPSAHPGFRPRFLSALRQVDWKDQAPVFPSYLLPILRR